MYKSLLQCIQTLTWPFITAAIGVCGWSSFAYFPSSGLSPYFAQRAQSTRIQNWREKKLTLSFKVSCNFEKWVKTHKNWYQSVFIYIIKLDGPRLSPCSFKDSL